MNHHDQISCDFPTPCVCNRDTNNLQISYVSLLCENAGWTKEALPLLKHPNITIHNITITGNKLNDIPQHYLKNFEFLLEVDFSSNYLKVVPLAVYDMHFILSLNLSNNEITSFDGGHFQNNALLQTLILSYNNLIEIRSESFSDLLQLKVLMLDNNDLVTIDRAAFFTNIRLEHINLERNSLNIIEDDTFSKQTKIRIIKLSRNQLRAVTEDMFAVLIDLRKLDLTSNQITSIDKDAFKRNIYLTILEIRNNSLRSLPESLLKHLNNLENLDLGNNPLGTLPGNILVNKPKLISLYLDFTNLSSIPIFPLLPELRLLFLIDNNIHKIYRSEIAILPNLIMLYLAGNPLKCDCHLRWFRVWYKNVMEHYVKPNNYFMKNWICFGPSYLNRPSIMQVNITNFKCDYVSSSSNQTDHQQGNSYIYIMLYIFSVKDILFQYGAIISIKKKIFIFNITIYNIRFTIFITRDNKQRII